MSRACQSLLLVTAGLLLGGGAIADSTLPSAAVTVMPTGSASAVLPVAPSAPAIELPATVTPAAIAPATVAPAVVAPRKSTAMPRASVAGFGSGQKEMVAPPGADSMRVPAGTPEEVEIGRRIYNQGIGANGKPIVGVRFGGVETSDASVICVTCHRRSGLGSVEGTDQVTPIAGRFIFSDDPGALTTMNIRAFKSFNKRHEPFTLATFAESIRQGKHINGRELSPIMPRYDFSDAEVKALATYLRTLSGQWSPGVSSLRIRFATVITPEVSAERRKVFIDTMKAAISQNNGGVAPGQRSMSAAEMFLRTQRWWDLDVWELTGAPETWARQLEERYKAEPVFAMVSGLGEGTWAPVHEFCQKQRVPCWFPSVLAPPSVTANDFYSLYFSKGVKLEAEVLAKHLMAAKSQPKRLIQILVKGDQAGREAAETLSKALQASKPAIRSDLRLVTARDANALKQALAKLGKRDAVMLWLRPADLTALAELAPPSGEVYLSAYLARGEYAPLPDTWKNQAQLIYPFQLPERRGAGLVYFHSWLKIRKLAVADELMQAEVYFAMSYLKETIMEMLHNLHGDYLIERTEDMLSLRESAKAEDEAREMITTKYHAVMGAKAAMDRFGNKVVERNVTPRPMPGRTEHAMAKRESTTIYPRLGLAQHQRYASKGAYIVRFGDAQSATKLVPVTEWIIP